MPAVRVAVTIPDVTLATLFASAAETVPPIVAASEPAKPAVAPAVKTVTKSAAVVPVRVAIVLLSTRFTEVFASNAFNTVASTDVSVIVIVSASVAAALASAVFTAAAAPAVRVAVTTPVVSPKIVLTVAFTLVPESVDV